MALHPLPIIAGMALVAGLSLGPAQAATQWGWEGDFERLHYRVDWGYLTAGEAILQARSPEPGQAEFLTETCAAGALGSLYPNHDRLLAHSRFNGRGWWTKAFRTTRNGKQGKDAHQYRFTDGGVVHIRDLATGNTEYRPVPTRTMDILTALYAVRGRPLEPGQEIVLPVLDQGKPFRLHVRVVGRQRLETLLGSATPTLYVRTYLAEQGTERRLHPLKVWLTADRRQLPVRLVAEAAMGEVTLELTEIRHRPPADPQAGLACR